MSALAEALVAAQAELPIALKRDAQGDGYKYMTLDKLIEAATRPILTKHGIAITLGSAITYARWYAWASALGIAAEEDTDAKDDVPF